MRLIRILSALALVAATAAQAQIPSLTGEIWSVCGDDGSATWHDTRLVFTEHDVTTGALAGYFDWQSSRGSYGREFFTGSVKPDGALALQGAQLQDSRSIVTSRYLGLVTADGQTIVDGVWLDGLPGIWAAARDGGQGTAAPLCETSEPIA